MAPHIPSRPLTSPHIRPSTSARTTRAPLYTCLLAHALAHAPHAPPHPSPLAPHPGPLNLHPSPFVLRPSFLTLTSPNHAWAQLSSHPLIPHLTPQLSPPPLAPPACTPQPPPSTSTPRLSPLTLHPSPCTPHPSPTPLQAQGAAQTDCDDRDGPSPGRRRRARPPALLLERNWSVTDRRRPRDALCWAPC